MGLGIVDDFAGGAVMAVDVVFPGPGPITSVNQVDNTNFDVGFNCPTTDSDGTVLTGLTKGFIICAAANPDGTNPMDGLGGEQRLALPGVRFVEVPLTEADAGAAKTALCPIANRNGGNYLCSVFSDS